MRNIKTSTFAFYPYNYLNETSFREASIRTKLSQNGHKMFTKFRTFASAYVFRKKNSEIEK